MNKHEALNEKKQISETATFDAMTTAKTMVNNNDNAI